MWTSRRETEHDRAASRVSSGSERGPVLNLGRREVVVIGGGLVGASIAYGLARNGARPLVLDEGDLALRASRAHNALIWVQGKGVGLPSYARWSQTSARRWPHLAALLREDTGIDVGLRQLGGFTFCLSAAELERECADVERIAQETGGEVADFQVLDPEETRARVPDIGPAVIGSIYVPGDGQVNALRLFHALHAAMAFRGCEYRADHAVSNIAPGPAGFRITGGWGEVTAEKVVLAGGLGNQRLAPMVGLSSPLRCSKGQIIVTEKCLGFFPYASNLLLQPDEGSVLISSSQDPNSNNLRTNQAINAVMAKRAILAFPFLANVNVLRTWAGFRIKTPDGFPIYEEATRTPGAFIVTCHSGVTLAANHVLDLAPQILTGSLDAGLNCYASRRFHVSSDH